MVCTLSASSPKKDPMVSDRDIDGLIVGGAYMSIARSWNCTPPCAAEGKGTREGRRRQQSLLPREGEGCQLQRELTSNWLTGYQGNQQKGTPLTYHGGESDLKIRNVTG